MLSQPSVHSRSACWGIFTRVCSVGLHSRSWSLACSSWSRYVYFAFAFAPSSRSCVSQIGSPQLTFSFFQVGSVSGWRGRDRSIRKRDRYRECYDRGYDRYHGWTFHESGACVHVWNEEECGHVLVLNFSPLAPALALRQFCYACALGARSTQHARSRLCTMWNLYYNSHNFLV